MVLESLVDPAIAKKKPYEVFFFGVVSATIGLFLSYWVFRQYSSLIMVFLITLATVPLLYFTMRSEEEADVELPTETSIMQEHGRVLFFLLILFFGITLSLSFWYVVLPKEMVNVLFSSQSQTILQINNQISGNAVHFNLVLRIFLNNIRVLIFSLLFSLLYGMGAIFILAWNATVIAAAIGNFIRSNLAAYASTAGLGQASVYFSVLSLGILRYAIHGIPEILAYFVGGLAGGIISMAIINHDIFNEKRERIMLDSAELVLLAIGLLFGAALVEVYVTPLLF